jgi:phosphoribosylformylglycinamidine cyclo-ligase
MGRLVLSPTRTYAPVIREVLRQMRQEIHGMIHCTGGGQTKVLHFIDALHVIKDDLFPVPPVFRYIRESSGTPWREMYQVFNMGHRMELYLSPARAQEVIDIAASYRIEAKVIGRVEQAAARKLSIITPHGSWEY